jgi:ribosomal protein S18 acetylase RimI-like enzyme
MKNSYIRNMNFVALDKNDAEKVCEMSKMATEILREHYDPIIGIAQNDYMLKRFQSVESIEDQLAHGYRYYFVQTESQNAGFVAFYPKNDVMYLSKFYLYKNMRGKGFARQMLSFVVEEAKKLGLNAVELNVNKHNPACQAYEKLGFRIIRSEKNDIGNGFFMDDYVCRLEVNSICCSR